VKNIIIPLISSLCLLSATEVLADADIALQTGGVATEATAHVDISVVVPEILIFGVGETGDPVTKLKWTSAISAAAAQVDVNNQTFSGQASDFISEPVVTIENGGTGSSTANNVATLPVFLFSNSGNDVTISFSMAGGATGGGTANVLESASGGTIPVTDFSVASGAGAILHPAGSGVASASANQGVISATDTWSYTYTPTVTPKKGNYEARITYIASHI
jgi:hypothetical protein